MPKKKKKTLIKRRPPPKGGSNPIQRIPQPATIERVQEVRLAPRGCPPDSSEIVPPDETLDNNRYLRWATGLHYTTDMKGATLEYMSKHPFFGKVSLDTLIRWSSQDRWVERRALNLEKWRKAIENKIGSELVKARTEQLGKMRSLFDRLMTAVLEEGADALKPKSLEGVVTAVVRLADLMDGWNEKIFHAVIPDMPSTSSISALTPSETKPRLNREEARAAAGIILKMRREEMRREKLKPVDQKPELTVLDGDK